VSKRSAGLLSKLHSRAARCSSSLKSMSGIVIIVFRQVVVVCSSMAVGLSLPLLHRKP
jgi:hypothetical protein